MTGLLCGATVPRCLPQRSCLHGLPSRHGVLSEQRTGLQTALAGHLWWDCPRMLPYLPTAPDQSCAYRTSAASMGAMAALGQEWGTQKRLPSPRLQPPGQPPPSLQVADLPAFLCDCVLGQEAAVYPSSCSGWGDLPPLETVSPNALGLHTREIRSVKTPCTCRQAGFAGPTVSPVR